MCTHRSLKTNKTAIFLSYLQRAVLRQGTNEVKILVLVEVVVELLALCGGLLPANLSIDLAPGPPVLSQALLEAGYLFLGPAMILCC